MSTAIETPQTQKPEAQSSSPTAIDVIAAAGAKIVAQEVAKNWKWIMAAGIVSLVAGVWALFTPVLATVGVGIFIGATFFVVGCVHIAGAFYRPKGMRLESLLVGIAQILTAAVMAFYPFSSLAAITIVAAFLFLAEGVVRTGFAIANRQVQGWGWGLFSGLMSLVLGTTILVGLPFDALYVIGILVGVNLLTSGTAHMALALEGRKVAKYIS